MNIYADPSFLVSLLYCGDTAHKKAVTFFSAQSGAQWITSSWSHFETVNSLRQLCLSNPGPEPAKIEGVRRLFKHWHERGPFLLLETETNEAVLECQQLSGAHATRTRMRSADVLHVALLEQITPDLFVTRDKDQHELAVSRAFKSVLIP